MLPPVKEFYTEIDASFLNEGFKQSVDRREKVFQKYSKPDSGGYYFEDHIIKGNIEISISESKISCYEFYNCLFNGSIQFTNTHCNAEFVFRGCQFRDVFLRNGDYKQAIVFSNCELRDFWIEGGNYERLTLSLIKGNLHISGGNFKRLYVTAHDQGEHLENIFIKASFLSGIISLYKLNVCDFLIYGTVSKECSIKVKSCRIQCCAFHDFENKGFFDLDSIKGVDKPFLSRTLIPEHRNSSIAVEIKSLKESGSNSDRSSCFEVLNSDLTNCSLKNIDFSSFENLIFSHSNLSGITISNISWPEKILTTKEDSSFTHFQRADHAAMRENYRQLKYVCSQHQDVIGEQHFHSKEMKEYDLSLPLNKIWTKAIIKLSRWTSDFGTSFIKPVLSILIIDGILFYVLYTTGQSNLTTNNLLNDNKYINILAEFIRVINPLHNNEPELTGWAFIIDVAIRICSSYFIYNIIRATRRFVK